MLLAREEQTWAFQLFAHQAKRHQQMVAWAGDHSEQLAGQDPAIHS